MLMLSGILKLVGYLCMLPLGFGVLLLLLFIAYIILFAWLSIFPLFSGHFRFMCEVWYLGLRIVLNKNMWKIAGIGVLLSLIAPQIIERIIQRITYLSSILWQLF